MVDDPDPPILSQEDLDHLLGFGPKDATPPPTLAELLADLKDAPDEDAVCVNLGELRALAAAAQVERRECEMIALKRAGHYREAAAQYEAAGHTEMLAVNLDMAEACEIIVEAIRARARQAPPAEAQP